MIQTITIKNYKSIQELTIELGQVNIFIGENGCGKTNILEAIALAGAASVQKLDKEFLFNRGIRATSPDLMQSAFEEGNQVIELTLKNENSNWVHYKLENTEGQYASWKVDSSSSEQEIATQQLKQEIGEATYERLDATLTQQLENATNPIAALDVIQRESKDIQLAFSNALSSYLLSLFLKPIVKSHNSFLIFCPENSHLRNFEEEGLIEPLGTKGQGLFKLLQVLQTIENDDTNTYPLSAIKDLLQVMDWFDDFEIKSSNYGEKVLNIQDKYLEDKDFTHRSVNEGFLYLLFYFSLFISNYTPSFFAIDNIETAFNPKLCRKLITILSNLAQKHNKQVIFTTHNPAILDGLNLNDDNQRLFVVHRNKLGHTKVDRIEKKGAMEGEKTIKLSEAFMRGYIGGLPKGF